MATVKQKLALKKVVENHGNVSRAMLDAGYDPTTAKNPKNLTESKAWAEMMDNLLPDEKILLRHFESLDATKIFSSHTEPDKEVPDNQTRLKAVELAYKVKGKMKTESRTNVQVNIPTFNVMSEDAKQQLEKLYDRPDRKDD